MEFKTWEEAHEYAQREANRMGIAHGIQKPGPFQRWVVRLLPKKEYRFGHELFLEAVEPMLRSRP